MDVQHAGSITGIGSAATARVATSLSPRAAATNTTAGTAKSMDTSSSSAATDPSDITSSDFLTLLVSELKNQDPTQPADPNAYITQLVDVNSLQQLIQINSGIGSLDTSVGATPTASARAGSINGESDSSAQVAANANAVASADPVFGMQPAAWRNAIWGGATSS